MNLPIYSSHVMTIRASNGFIAPWEMFTAFGRATFDGVNAPQKVECICSFARVQTGPSRQTTVRSYGERTAGIDSVHGVRVHIGVQIGAPIVPDGVGLQEPPEPRRVIAALVEVGEAERFLPGIAEESDRPADAAIFVVAGGSEERRAGLGHQGGDRAALVGV